MLEEQSRIKERESSSSGKERRNDGIERESSCPNG
jgi:hypothetical protein